MGFVEKLWSEQTSDRPSEAEIEASALEVLETSKNPIARHFAYNDLIKFYYKQRATRSDAIEKCVHYCVEDINSIEAFIKKWIAANGEPIPFIPSFKRLMIIEEKGGAVEDAIELCEHAISLGLNDYDTKGGYPARLETLKAKLKKQQSN